MGSRSNDPLLAFLTAALCYRVRLIKLARALDPKFQPPAPPTAPSKEPQHISIYRDGQGRWRRLVVTAERREPPDLDRFVAALLPLAMDRVEREKSGTSKNRGSGPSQGADA